VQPLRGDVEIDPAVSIRDSETRLRPERRLVLHADLVFPADDDGRLLRRIRRDPDGREVVLIDNRLGPGLAVGVGVGLAAGVILGLAAPVITMPRERYIVDVSAAPVPLLYETLEAPPLVAIERQATWDAFLWVYSASYLFTCLFAFGVIRWGWHERVTIRLDAAFVRRLLAAGLPLALAFTITIIYAQLDIVLLQLFKNFQVVGWYSAANKYIDAVAWVPQSAMGAVFPALSLLAAGDRRRLAFAYEKSYKMLAILGLPLAVGLGVTAESIVHATRGFEQSIPALRILAPSVALLFVNNAFIYTLTAINRQLDFTRLALVTLAVNVVLNLGLIPPYGYLGAAAASTLTEVALFAGGWWLLRRHLASLSIVRSIAPVLASAAIMGIVVYSFRTWPLVVVIIIGAAVYLTGLLGLRALDPEEWSIVRSGFRGR